MKNPNVGAAVGVVLDNISAWVAIGAGIKVAIGTAFSTNNSEDNTSEE
ncbi:MAG TPA: hypothetical protein VJ972_09275 [Anaerolineales bacterium]|nr:hypothetical protein [Anaerolineales bacterium]